MRRQLRARGRHGADGDSGDTQPRHWPSRAAFAECAATLRNGARGRACIRGIRGIPRGARASHARGGSPPWINVIGGSGRLDGRGRNRACSQILPRKGGSSRGPAVARLRRGRRGDRASVHWSCRGRRARVRGNTTLRGHRGRRLRGDVKGGWRTIQKEFFGRFDIWRDGGSLGTARCTYQPVGAFMDRNRRMCPEPHSSPRFT